MMGLPTDGAGEVETKRLKSDPTDEEPVLAKRVMRCIPMSLLVGTPAKARVLGSKESHWGRDEVE